MPAEAFKHSYHSFLFLNKKVIVQCPQKQYPQQAAFRHESARNSNPSSEIWLGSSGLDFVWKEGCPVKDGHRGSLVDTLTPWSYCILHVPVSYLPKEEGGKWGWEVKTSVGGVASSSQWASCLYFLLFEKPFHIHYWGEFITWNVNFFLGLRTKHKCF